MDKFYLVVDLEATCWDTKNGQNPNSEIIEIGAVMLDDKMEIMGEFDQFVRPILNPILSDFCKELTHIKQEDVDDSNAFLSVYGELMQFIGDRQVIFCSWGEYDKKQFRRDCILHNVPEFPKDDKFINIKRLFAEKAHTPKCGVSRALAMLEMKFEGSPHRGIDDAKNIAKIFKVISDPSFVNFPDLGLIVKVENCISSVEGSLRQIKQAIEEYKNMRGGVK